MPPSPTYLRLSLLAALFAWNTDVSALGLGELRTRSFLGEPLAAELEVLTTGKETVDAGCFRLRSPQDETDLPWLRRGTFDLHKGPRMILEIRSAAPLRDPVLQIGIAVGCGHEVQRDYMLFLSPRGRESDIPIPPVTTPVAAPLPKAPPLTRRREADAVASESPPRLTPRRIEKRPRPAAVSDRLVLSGGGEAVGEPSLRLATELLAWKEGAAAAREAQRDLLRLEYRMLAAMNEQATSQLAAAEKLRHMEMTLADLQQRASDFTSRIEKRAAPVGAVAGSAPPLAPVVPSQPAPELQAAAPPPFFSEWSFYGAMLGAVLGIAGWLGWRQYRERRERGLQVNEPIAEPITESAQTKEIDALVTLDLPVEPLALATPMPIDVPLDVEEAPPAPIAQPAPALPPGGADSQVAVAGATVDEHFEVNPVMELAEIMLSFGRVKGAAQALQEYIDHNPEEALQPWIRLMDVYRMAGMHDEFDRLAHELNQHFNVEVQSWNRGQAVDPPGKPIDFAQEEDGEGPDVPPQAVPKALRLEDIEHIRKRLTETWGSAECLAYLNQLLHDNRGGKRSGFTLPVVEEILFLTELLETRRLMESDGRRQR